MNVEFVRCLRIFVGEFICAELVPDKGITRPKQAGKKENGSLLEILPAGVEISGRSRVK